MKIIEMEQNTLEWENFRRTKIGASDCPAICGLDPYKSSKKLWVQKFVGEKQWVTPAMERGKLLEPLARHRIEEDHQCMYYPIVVQHFSLPYMIASLDGYCEENGLIIEIKCPGERIFDQITIERNIPESYIYQIHHQMIVSNTRDIVLAVFNGLYLEEFEIHQDEAIVDEILRKEEIFYKSLIEADYGIFEPIEEENRTIRRRKRRETRDLNKQVSR